jgi:hypothetical protein
VSDELISRAPGAPNYEELADRYRRRFNEVDAEHAHWRTQQLNVLELGTVPRDEELIRMTVAKIQGQRDELAEARAEIVRLERELAEAHRISYAFVRQWKTLDYDVRCKVYGDNHAIVETADRLAVEFTPAEKEGTSDE